MNRRILLFNIVYYLVTITFIVAGNKDPGSSLGYGYFIVAFWIIAGILLTILFLKNILRPKTFLDKLGIVTATPILPLIYSMVMVMNQGTQSESYFTKNSHRYKILTRYYTAGKKIEYYKSTAIFDSSQSTPKDWMKDSTWVHISKSGDTLEKKTYQDGVAIK